MSQEAVYNALKKLGGQASTLEIKQVIAEQYPNTTMKIYVSNRLRKLQKKKIVKLVKQIGVKKNSTFVWKIIGRYA